VSQLRRIIVIHSPHSGRSAELSQALAYLQQSGLEIAEVTSIANLDGLPAQGRTWQEQSIDLAIAAGGDGLVGGVITHIAESGLPLGILPLGTSNDIARSAGIPQDLRMATEVIRRGKIVEIDIGAAYPSEQAPHAANPQPGKPAVAHFNDRRAGFTHGFFAHALTVGLNVQFAQLATNVATRQRYGRMTYPFAAFEVLLNHKPLEMQLHFEGLALRASATPGQQSAPPIMTGEQTTLQCRALQAAVINAPIFGGTWQLVIPGASLHDRLLDIVVFQDIDLDYLNTTIMRFFNNQEPAVQTNGHIDNPLLRQAELTGLPGIHHVQARAVTITTSVDPQDVTLDGEIRGQTPVYVGTADEQLRLLVPA
jgi:diacylglycerol kinase (ATP)